MIEYLKKNKIKHAVSESGVLNIPGSLYLSGLTSIPDGFNPTVGGYLYLRGLTSIPDGFNPTVGGSLYLSGLTSIPDGFNPTVGGYLDLSGLTSIPDGFNPTVGGNLYLSGLTSIPDGFNPTVGGYLDLSGLTSIPDGFNPTVGGYLDLSGLTSIPDGFNPTVGGYLYLSGCLKAKTKPLPVGFLVSLKLSLEVRFNTLGYTIADGILARILHRKGNVSKIQIVGKKEHSWMCNDDDGNYAHGATLEKAYSELDFKQMSENVDQFKNMPKETVKTPDEWALVYRAITRACELGTDRFIKLKGELKESYTLSEIIEQTRGAFGHERFVEVVK